MRQLLLASLALSVLVCVAAMVGCGEPARHASPVDNPIPDRLSGTSGGPTPQLTGDTKMTSTYTYGTADEPTTGSGTTRALLSLLDINSNQAHALLGYQLLAAGLTLEYADAARPSGVSASAVLPAIQRAASAWQAAQGTSTLVQVAAATTPLPAVPQRDGHCVVGWTGLQGQAPGAVCEVIAWSVNGVLIEADIYLDNTAPWAINTPILFGLPYTAQAGAYDVQSVASVGLGHLIGLAGVQSDGNAGNGDETDATMTDLIAYGECNKQTLTSGDGAGALSLLPLLSGLEALLPLTDGYSTKSGGLLSTLGSLLDLLLNPGAWFDIYPSQAVSTKLATTPDLTGRSIVSATAFVKHYEKLGLLAKPLQLRLGGTLTQLPKSGYPFRTKTDADHDVFDAVDITSYAQGHPTWQTQPLLWLANVNLLGHCYLKDAYVLVNYQ
ncbi:MAG: hypothetical protein HYU66_07420 [Armatimonadetes bacterium]|nr:hypothetical protein [Armatimonadota bacterium]